MPLIKLPNFLQPFKAMINNATRWIAAKVATVSSKVAEGDNVFYQKTTPSISFDDPSDDSDK